MKKIVICEDHPIYSKGLEDFLKEYYLISGIFSSGIDCLSYLKNNSIDILLLDLNLIDISGIEVLKALKKAKKSIKVLVISMYNDKVLIEKCEKLQAHGYCSKHILNDELLDVLGKLKDGEFIVDKSIRKRISHKNKEVFKQDFSKKEILTTREKELVKLLSKGLSSKEAAENLYVSIFTVNTHKKNIYKKLNIKTTAELVTFYYENF